jgi:hypothetical protein
MIRCTVSLIYINKSDDAVINKELETDVDIKDSLAIDLSKEKKEIN